MSLDGLSTRHKQTKEYIKVMYAWTQGYPIEYTRHGLAYRKGPWKPVTTTPSWNFKYWQYRVVRKLGRPVGSKTKRVQL